MADKKIQNLNNKRTSVQSGDQFAIGGVDGFTYRANLNVLQSFLLENSLSTSTITSPQSAIVKAEFDKIRHYEFALLAPQFAFNIAHNRNAFITSIKFSSTGNAIYDGVVVNYTEIDTNNVSFTLDTPLQTGAKIKIQFNL
jgi:hypothetical protein